eukprot:scaffold24532_cov157-Cylindrotheca_fusiformis.AAC.3
MKFLHSVCFLLLLATKNGDAVFWNKKDKQDGGQHPRRRLTESSIDVDVDAATGTVRHTSPQGNKQSSCDSQMAESLVRANGEVLEAKAERDDLQREKMAALEEIHGLKNSLARAEEAEREWSDKLAQIEAVKDEKIKSLTDSLKMSQDDLVTEYESQLARETERHLREIEELQNTLRVTNEEHLSAIRELEFKNREAAENAERTLQTALQEAQHNHLAEVESLRQQLQEQAREAEEILQKHKDEAENILLSEVRAKDEQIEEVKAHAKNVELALREHLEEVELWRGTFANRSYCNLTYIGEDITWAGQQAYDKSATVSRNAYETTVYYSKMAAKKIQEKTSLAWKATKKYSKQASVKTMKFHNETVKPKYDKHVDPLVQKHVVPLVAKTSAYMEKNVTPKMKKVEAKVQPKYEQFKAFCQNVFDAAARHYGVLCTKTYNFSEGVAKKHEIELFDTEIAPHWKYSCQNPKSSLKAAMIGFLVILFLPSMLRLVLGIIVLIWRIFVAITPLRFFVGKKKSTSNKKPTVAPANRRQGDIRVKKKRNIAKSQ